MEDFEKDFPDFDWKNIPAYRHPKGKDCPCPKHEFIREQINISKNLNNSSSSMQDYSKHSRKAQITLKLCPDHYNVYFKEVIPSMPTEVQTHDKSCDKTWSSRDPTDLIHVVRSMLLL